MQKWEYKLLAPRFADIQDLQETFDKGGEIGWEFVQLVHWERPVPGSNAPPVRLLIFKRPKA